MLIKEIFAADVTRDIAPVVYFHEKDPGKVAEEVSEYIITGGYPESDPRHKRIESGIHEQFVKLLEGIASELQKKHGPELPASWVSGFYGSGKSIFAKLLGLSLDGMVLPDGRALADALLARDDSPLSDDFRKAWEALRGKIDPLAVVFDVGTAARDNEHIHSAVKRQIEARLGYCTVGRHVAEFELKLELDGKWDEFCRQAEKTLKRPWDEAKLHQMAEDDFSEVLHDMFPDRYTDPMSWLDSRAGSEDASVSSVAETTRAIGNMLGLRAPGKTLFVVVDEVSQYIHRNEGRMLKLQSFVSDLGQKLKGQAWLMATGQQKLEDTDEEVIKKLKDRFPPKLRAHLAATNIRDVVHKRLLKKDPSKEKELRDLFQKNRSDLKLYGYACESITEEDFLEVYPMLPGHVDLLMRITSSLRARSTRIKGDDHAIRGLLQLLGELFRDRGLGDKEVGALVTLDAIYDVQQSALDADIQNTMARILSDEKVSEDETAARVAKAVSLLELIAEQEPVTAKLIAQCLYFQVGMGATENRIQKALEKLTRHGLLTYSEKMGYKLQSTAGQEWQRERDSYPVTREEISTVVAEKLKELMGKLERPKFKGKPFPWIAFYSDGHNKKDERVQSASDQASVYVDFRYLTNKDDRASDIWVRESASDNLKNRLVWVCGSPGSVASDIRELARSKNALSRYEHRVQSISQSKQRLFFEEQSRREELEKQALNVVAQVFMEGRLYFRGRDIDKANLGTSFASVLFRAAESILPELYNFYEDFAISPAELKQLLEPNLSGASNKFMSGGLGILDMDAGKYVPSCSGQVPTRILRHVEDSDGDTGVSLISRFAGPPHGYPPDVIRACLAGLLRGSKIRIRPDAGPEITSVRDPGAKDMFLKDRELKRADILPPSDKGITARDRIAVCKFFENELNIPLDRENDAIADAVFQQFPNQAKRLQELEGKYNRLPNRPELPESLTKLKQALEDCKRSRHVEPTVRAVKKNLDVLRDGIQQLGVSLSELTDKNLESVSQAMDVLKFQATQLRDVESLGEAAKAVKEVVKQMDQSRPWRDIASIAPQLELIKNRYKDVRQDLIDHQEQIAQEIRERVKQRKGFEKLDADQSHKVLRPITTKLIETSPDAVSPTLAVLKDSAPARLKEAEEESNSILDDILSELTEQQVIKFRTFIIGREVGSKEEIENLVNDLKDRLLAQWKENTRIRLV